MTSHFVSRERLIEFPPPVRDPRVVILALSSLASGITLLSGGPVPASIAGVLPDYMLPIWAAGLACTGGGFILAALWRDVITGVLIEAAACVIAVLAVAAYIAGALTELRGQAFVQPVIVTGAYGIGCAVRVWMIRRDLRRGRARQAYLAHLGDGQA